MISIRGYIVPNDDKWIYDFLGYDSVSPADIAAALQQAAGRPVTVEINSLGGEISAGSEIYSLLRGYAGDVEIHVLGNACSAASVVAMARRCLMAPTAMMMVHNVSTGAEGDYHVMDDASGRLQTANRALASAYMAKSGMTEKEALDMMDATTWLTAQDAVERGLVDGVLFDPPAGAETAPLYNGLPGIPREALDKIRNLVPHPQRPGGDADFLRAKYEFLKLGGNKE